MALVEPISFNHALELSKTDRRHLLLGNGFSIAAHRAFGYPALYGHAVRNDPSLAALFPGDDNPNFEDALRAAGSHAVSTRIREALIGAVAAVHPYSSAHLTESECRSCRSFLEHFIGSERVPLGSVFTTNYDLLLTWVLSRQSRAAGTKARKQLHAFDGFMNDGEWREGATAQVYYLHGAVHIYQRPFNAARKKFFTEMLRYEHSMTPLTKQVASHVEMGDLPVFVAEGTAAEKRAAMGSLDYLKVARRRFTDVCSEPENVLFTFGHSFGESDNHIADMIGNGQVGRVYLGVYSPSDVARGEVLACSWARQRRATGAALVAVQAFDARSCSVWSGAQPGRP